MSDIAIAMKQVERTRLNASTAVVIALCKDTRVGPARRQPYPGILGLHSKKV